MALVADALVGVVVVAVFILVRRWSSRRYRAAGKVECVVRDFDGERKGRVGRWRHGVAAVESGRLMIKFRGPGGFRAGGGSSIELNVRSAVDRKERLGPSNLWNVNPFLHVVTITTPDRAYDIGVPGADVQGILNCAPNAF